jgi:phage terminase small subunit
VAKLTPKQQRFVDEYLVDLNATQAAIRAGYSEKTARAIGSENLTKPDVAAAIEKGRRAAAEKAGITQDRVLKETELLSFSNIQHYMLDDEGILCPAPGAPEGVMRAVSSVKYKTTTRGTGESKEIERTCEFKLWDKPGILKVSGRHVGLKGFAEKFELSGPDGDPIQTVTEVRLVQVDPEEA